MRALTRRETLQGLAAACVACDGAAQVPGTCATASTGTAPGYCLVEPVLVRVDAGALLAEGEAVLVRVDDQTGVIVARDAQGYFARSAVCTHACCLVTLCDDDTCTGLLSALAACGPVGPSTSGRALCPCHGSEFDLATGAPQTGPATVDLPAYEVSVDGTDLVVDTARVVAVAARTAA